MGSKIGDSKKLIRNNHAILLIFGLALGGLIFAGTAMSSEQGVVQTIKSATKKIDPDRHILIPKDVVKARENYQGGIFYTETRKNRMDRFKCSACHGNKEAMIQNANKTSHADIVLTHGQKDGPENCNTCHDPKNRDYLISAKGESIDVDHVYNMCGQCHFRQKNDWIGGAHGKRVTYWAGQRVVKNCTSCHNPHSPRFEKRMPATYSVPLK